jgi:bacterioferritin
MSDEINVQIDNASVLRLLQEAVDAETTSRNLYWARSVYWRGKGFDKLAKYYLDQSNEDHAQVSADRMTFLGSHPSVSPSPVAKVEGNVREQLEQDLAVEVQLADGYAEWVKTAAEAGDYVTEDLWRGVLKGTQEHVNWLQQQIEQCVSLGEQLYLASWKPSRENFF